MPTGNDSRRLFTTGFARHFYIKFLRNVFLQRNTDTLFINQFLSLFYSSEYCLSAPRADNRTSRSTHPKPQRWAARSFPYRGFLLPLHFQDISTQQYLYFLRFGPKVSVAFATHNATAIGSVHPIAGITSRCIKAIICFFLIQSSVQGLYFAQK